MSLLHNNKNYRQLKTLLEAKGIALVSGDPGSSGKTELRVEYKGTEARMFVLLNKVTGRSMRNLVRDARESLRQRGAIFTEAEMQDNDKNVVQLPLPEAPAKKRHVTRLTRQEKADLYALVQSGAATFLEACETFNVHVSTGKIIMDEGNKGDYNNLIDPKYWAAKFKVASPLPAAPVQPHDVATAIIKGIAFDKITPAMIDAGAMALYGLDAENPRHAQIWRDTAEDRKAGLRVDTLAVVRAVFGVSA